MQRAEKGRRPEFPGGCPPLSLASQPGRAMEVWALPGWSRGTGGLSQCVIPRALSRAQGGGYRMQPRVREGLEVGRPTCPITQLSVELETTRVCLTLGPGPLNPAPFAPSQPWGLPSDPRPLAGLALASSLTFTACLPWAWDSVSLLPAL